MKYKIFFLCLEILFICQCIATLGGWKPIATDSDKVNELQEFAIQNQDEEQNSDYKSKTVTVEEAYSQVVAGINYKLVFNVGESTCTTNDNDCSIQPIETCVVIIYERSWENLKKVTEFTCQPTKDAMVKGRLTGGSVKIDPNSPELADVVDFVVKSINARSNSMYHSMARKIISATSQVVQGIKYMIEIEFVQTSCRNNGQHEDSTLLDCPPKLNSLPQRCSVTVWSRSWLNPPMTIVNEPICLAETGKQDNVVNGNKHMDQTKAKTEDYYHALFEDFKKKFNKQYVNDEENRYSIFKSNMKIVETLQKNELGTATYGATQFADLSPEEFKRDYLTPTWDTSYDPRLIEAEIPQLDEIPESFDWRDHGAVTEVKNQGACGSCWAFSTTGNIEGQMVVKGHNLTSLSEQELVDCDKLDLGCNGGLPSNAYHEIMRIGGLETEEKYPYHAHRESCQFKPSLSRVNVTGALNISSNEDDMAAWLVENGPISIGINAFAMQFYFGGISHPFKFLCPPSMLDHGVLIVGYGVKNGIFGKKPYWIVKNSWGPYWGEKGYYLVYRGKGVCGLNTMCTSAIVE